MAGARIAREASSFVWMASAPDTNLSTCKYKADRLASHHRVRRGDIGWPAAPRVSHLVRTRFKLLP